jgi:hypothetical protein
VNANKEHWLRNITQFNLAMVIAGLLIIGLILGALADAWDGAITTPTRPRGSRKAGAFC